MLASELCWPRVENENGSIKSLCCANAGTTIKIIARDAIKDLKNLGNINSVPVILDYGEKQMRHSGNKHRHDNIKNSLVYPVRLASLLRLRGSLDD